MIKRINYAIPALVIFLFLWAALANYPESARMMEKLNFFVWTPEFLSLKLGEYPGLNALLTTWLLQFFKDGAGVIIEAGLLALLTLLAALTPRAWGRSSWTTFSLIPAVGLAFLCLHRPSATLEGIFFFSSLIAVGYVCHHGRPWMTTVVIALVGILSFGFAAFPVTLLLMLSLAVLQGLRLKPSLRAVRANPSTLKPKFSILNLLLPLLFIVLTVVVVKVLSEHQGFIPFDRRWWFVPEIGDNVTELLLLFAAPVVLMLVPTFGKSLVQAVVNAVVSIIVGLVCYNHIADNEGYQVSEDFYHYSALAEQGEWQQLLSDINEKGAIQNNVYLQFALLAESRLGTLPEHLFLYPINTPETFCPRLESSPASCDFCRIFYRELGFLDEAFHQSFQYGMMASSSCGFCAYSLRHMAEYTVQMGDSLLAEKYLYLLERTSNNGDLVAELRSKLQSSKAEPQTSNPSVPLRGDNFTMAHAFPSEMAYHLDADPTNRAALDYLLCSLLLTKRLQVFNTVLTDFADIFKGASLPRAYGEAACMIYHLQPAALSSSLCYDPELNAQFEEFTRLHNAGQDDSAYRGTFWYYYVYAQIPPQQEWIQQSQSS